MPRGGGFGRGGFGMRRYGAPLIGMGGMGGMGSPLLTGLMTGGIGYLLGSNASQQAAPQVQQVMPVPMYPPPQAPPGPSARGDSGLLAQLQLLGDLHNSGVLTDAEFAREKARLLGQ